MCLNLIGEHNILHEELYKSFTQTYIQIFKCPTIYSPIIFNFVVALANYIVEYYCFWKDITISTYWSTQLYG